MTTNSRTFRVPTDASVKLVHAGKIEVAHVKHAGRVIVLSEHGQLVESDEEARARGKDDAWRAVAGT